MTCGSVAVYFSGLRAGKKRHLEATPLSPLRPPFLYTTNFPSFLLGRRHFIGREGGGEGGKAPLFWHRGTPELLRRGGAKRGGAEAGDRTLLVYRKLRDMGK